MAKQSITQLKNWFITQAKPIQNQFWDWLDSFRHKDDKILISDLEDELKTLIQGLPNDINTAIETEATTRANEDGNIRDEIASRFVDLYDSVDEGGNTLNKLYTMIQRALNEETVADRAARDAYDAKLGDHVFVTDDGDGNWALYKAITAGVGADYVKLSDPDLLNAAMTSAAIKLAYESNYNTNAFTNDLKSKLETLSIDTSVEGSYNANFSIAIAAKKMLRDVVIVPTSVEQTIQIGTTIGGSEVWDATTVAVGGGADNPFGFNKWFNTARTLYVSGVTADTYFKFFIQ